MGVLDDAVGNEVAGAAEEPGVKEDGGPAGEVEQVAEEEGDDEGWAAESGVARDEQAGRALA